MCYAKVATKTLKTLYFKEFHLSVIFASQFITGRPWEETSRLSYLLSEQPFICKGLAKISECLQRSFKVEFAVEMGQCLWYQS